MKIPGDTTRPRRPLQVEMTPMIDVVFLLLIFFLWTASFRIAEQRLPSSLAEETTTRGNTSEVAEETDFEPVIVRIGWADDAPRWNVNGRSLGNLAGVSQTLLAVAEVKPDLPVIVDPDARVPLGYVIDVYDLTRNLGFDKVQFAAQ